MALLTCKGSLGSCGLLPELLPSCAVVHKPREAVKRANLICITIAAYCKPVQALQSPASSQGAGLTSRAVR